MKKQIPINPMPDGTCRTIKKQYNRSSIANFTRRGGGMERQRLPLCVMKVMQIWKSRQNGMVYDPIGIAPCLCVGNHSGVEPKIIEYVDSGRNNSNSPDKG